MAGRPSLATSVERATVLRDLSALASLGVAIDAFGLLPDHGEVLTRAIEAFGSLGAARRAAELRRGTRLGDDSDPVALLRDLAARGVRLTPGHLRLVGEEQLLKLCYARFGSWPAARAAARLEAPERKHDDLPPPEAVLDAIRGRARSTGGVLAARDLDRDLARAAEYHFGKVTKAIGAAGVPRRKPNARWTRDLLLDELAARLERGESITIPALRDAGRDDLLSAIQRHIGPMTTAQRLATERARIAPSTPAPRPRPAPSRPVAPPAALARQRAVRPEEKIERLAAELEPAIRRLAHGTVARIFEEERARRRVARTVDTVTQAFEDAFRRVSSTSEHEARKSSGVVKSFNEDRGYGFIRSAAGEDVFVHRRHVVGRGPRALTPGETVTYREHVGERGRFATHVRRA